VLIDDEEVLFAGRRSLVQEESIDRHQQLTEEEGLTASD
jgi:hypothetical protein